MERSPFSRYPRAARERDDSGEYEFVAYLEKGHMFQIIHYLILVEIVDIVDVQMLYNKWWKNTGDVCTRQDKSKDSKVSDQATKSDTLTIFLPSQFQFEYHLGFK